MLDDILTGLGGVGFSVYKGYAPNNAKPPHAVLRPVYLGDGPVPLSGPQLAYPATIGVYCRGASVEASFNMAVAAIKALDGLAMRGTQAVASMGYTGAVVDGAYESQVTVTFTEGSL